MWWWGCRSHMQAARLAYKEGGRGVEEVAFHDAMKQRTQSRSCWHCSRPRSLPLIHQTDQRRGGGAILGRDA